MSSTEGNPNAANETAKKQDYLREEIIKKKYDPAKFIEYLSSQRENGDDIDAWNLEELIERVKDFKKEFEPTETVNDVEDDPLLEEDLEEVEPVSPTKPVGESDEEGFDMPDPWHPDQPTKQPNSQTETKIDTPENKPEKEPTEGTDESKQETKDSEIKDQPAEAQPVLSDEAKAYLRRQSLTDPRLSDPNEIKESEELIRSCLMKNAASKPQVYKSENERARQELHRKAIQEKRSTIVRFNDSRKWTFLLSAWKASRMS